MSADGHDSMHWDGRPKGSWVVCTEDSSAGGSGVCPSFAMTEAITSRCSLGVELRSLADSLDAAERVTAGIIESHRAKANEAYSERNRLVAALARIFPASLEPAEGAVEPGWSWVVFVDLPTGQATWPIPDKELHFFDGIVRCEGRKWDTHTASEKYGRVHRLRDVKDLFPRAKAVDEADYARLRKAHADLETLIRNWHANITEKPLSDAASVSAADLVNIDYRTRVSQVRELTKNCAALHETLDTVLDQLGAPTGTDHAAIPALLREGLKPRVRASERTELVKVMGLLMDDAYAAQHQTFGQYRSSIVKYIGGLLAPEKTEEPHV